MSVPELLYLAYLEANGKLDINARLSCPSHINGVRWPLQHAL